MPGAPSQSLQTNQANQLNLKNQRSSVFVCVRTTAITIITTVI